MRTDARNRAVKKRDDEESGVAAAQGVFRKVLEKADPDSSKKVTKPIARDRKASGTR
jgi:hypothetical protein